MKKQLMLGICMGLFSSLISANQADDILGLWKAHDDKGNPTGFIRVMPQADGYIGKIEKGLPTDKEDKFCHACRGERKDQKLVGMTILKDVNSIGDVYEGSEILDPFSGNTYRVKLQLKEAGKKLEVRGYVGFSLFGRTQIWERAE